jgi:hypothetical protein
MFFRCWCDGRSGQHSLYSDSLRAGRCGNLILVVARFSEPVQTGPGTYSANYSMGTGFVSAVKRPGCGIKHPPQSSAESKEKSTAVLLRPLCTFMALNRVNFTFLPLFDVDK